MSENDAPKLPNDSDMEHAQKIWEVASEVHWYRCRKCWDDDGRANLRACRAGCPCECHTNDGKITSIAAILMRRFDTSALRSEVERLTRAFQSQVEHTNFIRDKYQAMLTAADSRERTLRRIGSQVSSVISNLQRRTGNTLNDREVEIFAELQKKWDAASGNPMSNQCEPNEKGFCSVCGREIANANVVALTCLGKPKQREREALKELLAMAEAAQTFHEKQKHLAAMELAERFTREIKRALHTEEPHSVSIGVICARWKKLSDGCVARCDKAAGHEGNHVDSVIDIQWHTEDPR